MENSRQHLNNLFFDPRRYDLSRLGRYKMQQQAGPATAALPVIGCRATVVAPLTGELLAEPRARRSTRPSAEQIDNAGVTARYHHSWRSTARSPSVKVISNGMVDAQNFFSFDVEAEAGVNERVSFAEIRRDPRHHRPTWRSRRSCCARTIDDLIRQAPSPSTTSLPPSTT